MEHTREGFSWRKRLKSFTAAVAGFKELVLHEHNARIHLVAAVLAVAAGFLLNISSWEWVAIVLVIGLVFAAELVNSAIEELSDVINPQSDRRIKRIKDYGAAAVLVAAMVSVVVGFVIFVPKITTMLSALY
jgi:diacylglycerol kinase